MNIKNRTTLQFYEELQLVYDRFNEKLRAAGVHVETGRFGADMKVELENDGPVTIIYEK